MSLGYRDKILWAAGFMDGEGSFRQTKLSHRQRGSATHTVSATQKEREPLDQLCMLFGGVVRLYPQHTTGRSYYKWTVNGPTARGIMMMLFPFLSSRRQGQIRVALSGPWSQRTQRPRSFRRSLAGQLSRELVFSLAV